MKNKYISRQAKDAATSNVDIFVEKRTAANDATSSIFSSSRPAKNKATKNS